MNKKRQLKKALKEAKDALQTLKNDTDPVNFHHEIPSLNAGLVPVNLLTRAIIVRDHAGVERATVTITNKRVIQAIRHQIQAEEFTYSGEFELLSPNGGAE